MHYKAYKTILSPTGGMNLFRGCQHGCIYCDARSTCYQMQHDFEDIEVKENAPAQLEQELRRRRRQCMIGTGAMTDPYIPLEKELRVTRQCLMAIERYGYGLAIQTKSDLILRDLDLIKAINRKAKAVVQMTLTTYDEDLCRIVEPGVCTTRRRFEVLKEMQAKEIPTVVWFSPVLPFLNDTPENLLGILDYCEEAGVWGIIDFGMGLTLREGDREYFYSALDAHFPGIRAKYQKRYGLAYELPSPNEKELTALFRRECTRRGIAWELNKIFTFMKTLPQAEQLSLF